MGEIRGEGNSQKERRSDPKERSVFPNRDNR
jgi:hypothetical protein